MSFERGPIIIIISFILYKYNVLCVGEFLEGSSDHYFLFCTCRII